MTLNDLEQDCYRRLNKNAASIDTNTQTRIRAFLNQRHREVLTLPDARQLRDSQYTFASVANQAEYGLPQAIARINGIRQADTEVVLQERPLDWYRAAAPDPSVQTGDPEIYVVESQAPLATRMSAADTLWAKSSSAADTTQTVSAYVTYSSGVQVLVTATLTGTTAVQLGSTSIIDVNRWFLSAACVGTVTLHQTSGSGTQLASIYAGATSNPAYTRLSLWPTPSGVRTYSVDYTRRVHDMASATDTPMVPEDFHRLLVYGACADECLHMNDQRYAVFKQEWATGVNDMKAWLHARPGYRPGGRWSERSGTGASNLGAWYPAGRW